MLAAMSSADLEPLHARTAGEYPVLARLIADEIARREDLFPRQFASGETCSSEFAAAA